MRRKPTTLATHLRAIRAAIRSRRAAHRRESPDMAATLARLDQFAEAMNASTALIRQQIQADTIAPQVAVTLDQPVPTPRPAIAPLRGRRVTSARH